jgi:pyrophosphatase PpaX
VSPLPGLEAVLFDFDGTLIDTGELIRTSFRHTLRSTIGVELSDEMLTANVGVPLIEQMEGFAPGRGDELVAVYREHNHAHHDDIARPFDGVEEMLAGLARRDVPMAVVTSKGRVAVGMGARLIGLDRFIDVVVTADDVHTHKPDAYPLVHAAGLLGVDVERTAYVGDSPHDIASANAAGAVSVAALWGMFSREVLLGAGPDYALSGPEHVVGLVDGDETRFGVG